MGYAAEIFYQLLWIAMLQLGHPRAIAAQRYPLAAGAGNVMLTPLVSNFAQKFPPPLVE